MTGGDTMSSYIHKTLLVNQRELSIHDVTAARVAPLTNFETSLFTFIQEWFSEKTSFLQHTSGSTGDPKAIEISREHMLASAALTRDALDLRPRDTALICLDAAFIAGKMMLVRSFLTNMRIVAVEPAGNPFSEISSALAIDFVALVPLQVNTVMNAAESWRLNSTRNILVGGAPISNGMASELKRFAGNIYSTYGMTETVSHVALWHVNHSAVINRFVPLPGVQCKLDDRGCLILKVPFLTQPVITNDLVNLFDDGSFEWLGRVDNIINSGGVKVIPEKVEEIIGDFFAEAAVENRFIVGGLEDPLLGTKVVLLLEGSAEDLVIESIRKALREKLGRYQSPREIYAGITFFYTKNGKVDRSKTMSQIGN